MAQVFRIFLTNGLIKGALSIFVLTDVGTLHKYVKILRLVKFEGEYKTCRSYYTQFIWEFIVLVTGKEVQPCRFSFSLSLLLVQQY